MEDGDYYEISHPIVVTTVGLLGAQLSGGSITGEQVVNARLLEIERRILALEGPERAKQALVDQAQELGMGYDDPS